MIFIEYVCRRLLGEPVYGTNWECPECGRAKLHVMPPKHPYPDRWWCWGCRGNGSEYDLVKLVMPDARWSKVRQVVRKLTKEYKKLDVANESSSGDENPLKRHTGTPQHVLNEYLWAMESRGVESEDALWAVALFNAIVGDLNADLNRTIRLAAKKFLSTKHGSFNKARRRIMKNKKSKRPVKREVSPRKSKREIAPDVDAIAEDLNLWQAILDRTENQVKAEIDLRNRGVVDNSGSFREIMWQLRTARRFRDELSNQLAAVSKG